jgi:NDP-sugar pyrophosphorylase family protein
MQSVILAGGLGTRLGPLGADTAKPMQPVAGRPFLELVMCYLAAQGVADFVLCVGHRADQVREHFGDGGRLDVRVRYSTEHEPLGTGGALRRALPLIDGERVLVSNGDSFVDFSVPALVRTHQQLRPQASMVLVRADDADRFGSVEVDRDGWVRAFAEKASPAAGLVNGGVYLVERELIERLSADGPSSLERDCFPALVAGQQLAGMPVGGTLVDIGTPESLEAARSDATFAALAEPVRC